MGITVEEISALLAERMADRGETAKTMREIKDTYNSDVVVPLPEISKMEKPAIANMINIGLDQTASRIASVMPNLYFPPVRPGYENSEKLATARTRAVLGWWDVNQMNLIQRKRARHLIGYSESPVILRPRKDWGCSEWQIQSPLDTFAAPSNNTLQFVPDDCIFVYAKNLAWLKKRFPDVYEQLLKSNNAKPSDMMDVIEYVDGDEKVVFAQSRLAEGGPSYQVSGSKQVPMSRSGNASGVVPVVIPKRINLDRSLGQFDSQLGMYNEQAMLNALNLIAIEKHIFPDTYLIGRPNMTPKFIQGPYDGRTGKVNIVTGGDIEVKQSQANQSTQMAMDQLERAQRMMGQTPSDVTGEAASNVRTGKRGDSIMKATIDMNIQESQEIFASSMEAEAKIAIAQAKAYFGNERKSFYIKTQKLGNFDYIAKQIFEDDNAVVTFSYAGVDSQGLIVEIAQRKGAGMMSTETAMELDPMITDVPAELARIDSENAKQALVGWFTQQSASGALAPADIARIAELVAEGKKTFTEAIVQAQAESQARQATQAPAGAPETQAGLGPQGQGAEQPTAAPSGPMPVLQALSSLTGQPNVSMKTKSGA